MAESLVIAFFHGLHKDLLSPFVQKTFVEFSVEMAGIQSMLVENLEDDPIHDNRLENLRYVKT